jgi:ABC-2 type transport system ATP-binding protein
LLATNDVTEAERYCDYVAFFYRGRLAAQGTPAALKANLRRESVFLESPGAPPETVRALEAWPGVGRVTHAPPAIHVTADDASAFVVRLFQWGGLPVTAVRIERSTLEDAYFQVCRHMVRQQEADL